MSQFATNKGIVNVLGAAFKPAKRNSSGHIVLIKNTLFTGFLLLGAIIGALCIVLNVITGVSDKDAMLGIYAGVAALFICGLLFIGLKCSKTVAEEEAITSYRWYGRKSIKVAEIREVSYSRFFGGYLKLKGDYEIVPVSMDTVGAAEFVEWLKGKLGEECCREAVEAIAKKQRELAQFSQ